jgi:hypothetical protein
MMFLRDFYCTTCKAVAEDVQATGSVLCVDLHCATCNKATQHEPVCNGGRGSRYRFNDFPDPRADPGFYRGQVTARPPKADERNLSTGQEKPLEHCHGGVIHESDKYDDSNARGERRDKVQHGEDRRAGKTPLVFDQKKET